MPGPDRAAPVARRGLFLGAAGLAVAAGLLYGLLLARQGDPVPAGRVLVFGAAIAVVVMGALVALTTNGTTHRIANGVALGAALTAGTLAIASFGVLLLAAAGLLAGPFLDRRTP